jgi:glycosyltransferase involved in cell wall biosynthesis
VLVVPDVTVLMPVFNAERHVGAAIESILAQTHRDFELLIVDDGSTDRSLEIAASYRDSRVRLITLGENRGLSGALNRGLAEAQCDWIARQDADDVSAPERLARQMATVARRPGLALLGCQAHAIDEHRRALAPVNRPVDEISIRWYGLFDNPFIHSTVLMRREVVWTELGGFDGAFDPYSQDYALWGRVMERYPVLNLPDRLLTYRVSASSIIGSVNAAASSDEYRTRFDGVVRTLVSRHLRVLLGDDDAQEDGRLMAGLVLGIEATAIDRFLAVFRRLLDRFRARHPEWRTSADFRRTLARQFDAIAYRVRPPSRASAMRVYLAGLAAEPSMATYLSWPRAIALCVLGAAGRQRLTELRHASR